MAQRVKRWVLNAFIVTHIFAILVWSLPTEMKFKVPVNLFFEPYFSLTGLWQGWDMFAPNPRNLQIRMDVKVTFRDQSEKVWDFPRMETLGFYERFQKERFRKWAHDNVRLDTSSRLWPATADYIARQFEDKKNPVVHMEFRRHWIELKLSETEREPSSTEWSHFTFYTWDRKE